MLSRILDAAAALGAGAAISLVGACSPALDPAEEARASWHAERLAKLRAEDGWLSLVGLDFLEDGEWSVGSGDAARLRYASCSAPSIGRFVVEGQVARWLPESGSSAVLERGTAGEALVADDQGPPSVVRDGPVSFALLRRGGKLALRVRDNTSPTRRDFDGIPLFPFDATRIVRARAEDVAPGRMVSIANVLGHVEAQPVAALLAFELDGATRRFVATKGAGERLFVVFGDATNGRGSYGGGRFLDLAPLVDGVVEIDFNRAFNPPCTFTAHATCPLPPEMNRLTERIAAGELAPAP